MGARGQLGGLARAAQKAIHVLDSAGFDIVLVETVGVGQSELDIAGAADTTIVVVTPAMGDTVQTLKAGILEIADVFALNKADQDGSQQTFRALRGMLHMRPAHDWAVPIVETRGHEGVGLPELWSALQRHQTWLEETGRLTARRAVRIRSEVLDLVERGLRSDVLPQLVASNQYEQVVSRVISRETDPDSGAEQILSGVSTDPERIGSK
jgi:LAO/AO transport system kinase